MLLKGIQSHLPLLIGAVVLFIAFTTNGLCTEEYAQKTGKECSYCHIDTAGGGELTAAGKAYAASIHQPAEKSHRWSASWLIRLVAGYIHILTAFLWFGTILYVHLVVKPAYASQGLPKGEVRVGLASMAVMALSGVVLFHFRVTSPQMLFHSWFGILLVIKIALFLVMVVSALFVVLVIGPRLRGTKGMPTSATGGELTASELSQFDGREGRPAYFAYNGRVFDVSASRLWKNGMHMGKHPAGFDLGSALGQAPHGEEKVLGMPVVGCLLQGDEQKSSSPPQRLFFFMAYMNLAIVFCIIAIIALWRWGG
jgi:predicted heme/steroid binding protein